MAGEEGLKERVEKLEEIVVQQRKKIEELEKENNVKKSNSTASLEDMSTEEDTSGISRRGFLKGLGVLGVGALAMSSPVASKMTVSSSTIEKDGQDIWQGGLFNTNDYLQLSGNNAMTGDLNLGGNSLTNVTNVDGVDVSGHVNSMSNPHSVDVSQIDTYSTSESDSNFASSGHTHNQLHDKYTDSEARSAVGGANIDISGDADTIDGYDIQKNGDDGSSVINFKTS